MKFLKYTFGIVFLIVIGFGLGWFTNTMNRFANGVIEDSKRNAYFLEEYTDSTGQIIITPNDLELESRNSNNKFLKPIIVEYAQDEFVKCDTASSTLAINICSLEMLELEQTKFDSLKLMSYKLYDSLIVEQNKEIAQWKKENELAQLDYVIDYTSIKTLHIKSLDSYLQYVQIESNITELEKGNARQRNYYKNERTYQLLKQKNNQLRLLINELQQ